MSNVPAPEFAELLFVPIEKNETQTNKVWLARFEMPNSSVVDHYYIFKHADKGATLADVNPDELFAVQWAKMTPAAKSKTREQLVEDGYHCVFLSFRDAEVFLNNVHKKKCYKVFCEAYAEYEHSTRGLFGATPYLVPCPVIRIDYSVQEHAASYLSIAGVGVRSTRQNININQMGELKDRLQNAISKLPAINELDRIAKDKGLV